MRILKDDGWVIDRIKGSHHIMKHPTKPGRPVIPLHNEELKPGTYNNILKQAGLK
ncbi:type II toxin-antitoxin system HicA family toxin [Veillonellaceae bacterium WCA-693-APC-5D-A]|uniref:Type II toxin-antitoxin system HicA family toxin n=1 Tax=Anaerovibrio slackiae TaxID=2652309 RepID=A0A6I2UBY2_9FIRM|nr:type II toxin-antitoxin system HicA family toxin [Anaerovibrio slackiae]